MEQNLFEFLLNLLLNLLLGATIDPAWVKQYSNLNTVDFFYKYPPKLPKNVGFMAKKWPKMVL
jgi:hypothetical protein